MPTGQYTAADLTPAQGQPTQIGKFSAADLDTPAPSVLDQLGTVPGKVWRAIKPIADVTAPAIGYQMYRKLSGQPNDLSLLRRQHGERRLRRAVRAAHDGEELRGEGRGALSRECR